MCVVLRPPFAVLSHGGPSKLSHGGHQRPRVGLRPAGLSWPGCPGDGPAHLAPSSWDPRAECSPNGAVRGLWPRRCLAHCHHPRAIGQDQPVSNTRFWDRTLPLPPMPARARVQGEWDPMHPQGRTPVCRPPPLAWPFLCADARAVWKPRASDREPGSKCMVLGPGTPKFTGFRAPAPLPCDPPDLHLEGASGGEEGRMGAAVGHRSHTADPPLPRRTLGLKACDPSRSQHRLSRRPCSVPHGEGGWESRLGMRRPVHCCHCRRIIPALS